MSKATKYAIDDTEVCARFSNLNLKNAQASLDKTIIWEKKSWKWEQKRKDYCIIARLLTQMFKTHVKTTFCM
jgi:hypothetical protein